MRTRGWWLTLCLVAAVPTSWACERAEIAEVPTDPWPPGLARPTSADEAASLRANGVSWTDRQVRQLYLERVGAIVGEDAARQAKGESAEARARAAFQTRHDARVTARAMMSDPAAVEALRARDRDKYGTPDGPTFEYLVERARQKGLEGDAVYLSIVESAQQTDVATNRSLGL